MSASSCLINPSNPMLIARATSSNTSSLPPVSRPNPSSTVSAQGRSISLASPHPRLDTQGHPRLSEDVDLLRIQAIGSVFKEVGAILNPGVCRTYVMGILKDKNTNNYIKVLVLRPGYHEQALQNPNCASALTQLVVRKPTTEEEWQKMAAQIGVNRAHPEMKLKDKKQLESESKEINSSDKMKAIFNIVNEDVNYVLENAKMFPSIEKWKNRVIQHEGKNGAKNPIDADLVKSAICSTVKIQFCGNECPEWFLKPENAKLWTWTPELDEKLNMHLQEEAPKFFPV